MARRQRRRLLQIIAMAFSGLLLGRPVHANTTRRQLGPLSQGQRMLIIEFLEAQATLLSTYVLAGIDDGADRYRSTLESQRRNADLLLGRVKRELFARIERSDMTAIEARWHTVSDAARTQPTLDIARLMLPMAQEVAAPLGNLLPAVDTQSLGGMEGRARRRLLMCQLMLDGLSACWGRDLAQWDLMEARRGLLDTWLNAVAQQGTDGVRLMAQWNLFASALPLHNARCLPGAAQTLQMVGERLYKLL